jgi:hypothetical protein
MQANVINLNFKPLNFNEKMAKENRMFILWKEEAHQLIAGIDAHICDKCIEQAHGIVLEETKSGDSSKLLGILF